MKIDFTTGGWKKIGGEVTAEEIWDYKNKQPGDTIVGLFVEKREEIGESNSILYILNVDGKNVGVWGCGLLNARFKNIKAGEEVGIVYLGKAKSQKVKGRSYYNFDVHHRSPEPEPEDIGPNEEEVSPDDVNF